MPLDDASQRLISFSLDVRPGARVFDYEETGGRVHHFGIRERHKELVVQATAEVETLKTNPFDELDLTLSNLGFYDNDGIRQTYAEFLGDSHYVSAGPDAQEFIAPVAKAAKGNVARLLLGLNNAINQSFRYVSGSTNVRTRVHDVFERREGVCQDFAHVFLSCVRSVGIPSRYVSGYLYAGDQSMRGEMATHAWVESLLPDGRWLALDPTNNLLANDHFVRVHLGRDYSEISPTRGIYLGPPAESLEVGVTVTKATPPVLSPDESLPSGYPRKLR